MHGTSSRLLRGWMCAESHSQKLKQCSIEIGWDSALQITTGACYRDPRGSGLVQSLLWARAHNDQKRHEELRAGDRIVDPRNQRRRHVVWAGEVSGCNQVDFSR